MAHPPHNALNWDELSLQNILELAIEDEIEARDYYTVAADHAGNTGTRRMLLGLAGDGSGKDVMDATRLVLDRLHLDAEYVHGDIGWEFWCKEGDAFPQRTIELLKNVNAAMFGAITSKPVKAAEAELVPGLKIG